MLEDEFEQTSVNMSTYLVAFIVANFTSITRNVSNTLVRTESLSYGLQHTRMQLCLLCAYPYTTLVLLCLFHVYGVCVAGVCVLCAREEGTHKICSGHRVQVAAVLQYRI
jgi:uncharacterized protein YqiB (DUF1249 family)